MTIIIIINIFVIAILFLLLIPGWEVPTPPPLGTKSQICHKTKPEKMLKFIQTNIARGTTDPGYRVYNLSYLFS